MAWDAKDLADRLRGNSDLKLSAGTVRNLTGGSGVRVAVKQSEHELQRALFAEIDLIAVARPDYQLIHAIPNGQYRPGQRLEPGTRAGYPDIAWDLAAGGYYGLRLELKVGRNTLSADQERWRDLLIAAGYYWACCYDHVTDCLAVLDWYYSLR